MATDARQSAGMTGAYAIVTCLLFAWGFITSLVGLVSQRTDYVAAFIVPATCYAVLCLFAFASRRARGHLSDEPAPATIH